MFRWMMAVIAVGAVGACSGGNPIGGGAEGIGTGAQPLIEEPTTDDPGEQPNEPGEDTDPDNIYAEGEDLTLNAMSFDPATNELVLNNLPFDGDDNRYVRQPGVTAAVEAGSAGGSGFEAYRAAETVSPSYQYYAIFRRAPTGYTQVGAVGTDRYIDEGFGGASAQRLQGSGALPPVDESYVFTGEYAAVRVIGDTEGPVPATQKAQYVTGNARIEVDIEDFDVSGAVEGVISQRAYFDRDGTPLPGLNPAPGGEFVSLATAQIDFDTWTINSSDATLVDGAGEAGPTGTWQGVFAGPNGQEVAGIVVLEGTAPTTGAIDPATGEPFEGAVRETGGFIATRP